MGINSCTMHSMHVALDLPSHANGKCLRHCFFTTCIFCPEEAVRHPTPSVPLLAVDRSMHAAAFTASDARRSTKLTSQPKRGFRKGGWGSPVWKWWRKAGWSVGQTIIPVTAGWGGGVKGTSHLRTVRTEGFRARNPNRALSSHVHTSAGVHTGIYAQQTLIMHGILTIHYSTMPYPPVCMRLYALLKAAKTTATKPAGKPTKITGPQFATLMLHRLKVGGGAH